VPRKRARTRLRELLDRIERNIEKNRKRKLKQHREFLRRYLEETFREYIRIDREGERTQYEQAYETWYRDVYRNLRFRIVRTPIRRSVRQVKKRDHVDTMEKRQSLRQMIFTRFTIWLRRYQDRLEENEHRVRPSDFLHRLFGGVELFRTMIDIRRGNAYLPIITIWKDRYLELHIDKSIERWLTDPERREATLRALDYIFRQVITTKQRIVIPPEDYEQLKGILRLLYREYVTYTRPMPCRRTQMAIKLTPITLHLFRGYAARLYVVRWARKDQMESGLLQVTDNIDIHFGFFRRMKYRGEVLSTMTIAGDTDNLDSNTPLWLWRDAQGIPREMLYAYEAMYLYHRIEDGLKRAIGKRENDASMGHCSVYIGFRKRKPYKKIYLKRIDRDRYRLYRWD